MNVMIVRLNNCTNKRWFLFVFFCVWSWGPQTPVFVTADFMVSSWHRPHQTWEKPLCPASKVYRSRLAGLLGRSLRRVPWLRFLSGALPNGVHSQVVPQGRWMVFVNGKIPPRNGWFGGSPMTQEPPYHSIAADENVTWETWVFFNNGGQWGQLYGVLVGNFSSPSRPSSHVILLWVKSKYHSRKNGMAEFCVIGKPWVLELCPFFAYETTKPKVLATGRPFRNLTMFRYWTCHKGISSRQNPEQKSDFELGIRMD